MDALILLAGLLYEAFIGSFILAVGGAVVVFVTALFARILWDKRYWDCIRIFAKAAAALLFLSATILIVAIVFAGSTDPAPSLVLPFLYSLWATPLTLTVVFLSVSALLLYIQYRAQKPFGRPPESSAGQAILLTSLAALSAIVALLFFNLTNSFMIAPTVPSGLQVILQAGRIDPVTQLGLMDNRSWIPLSIKLLLIGTLSFSATFSGAAAVRRLRGRTPEDAKWLDFVTSWGFKVAILFGAPVGVIGYWNASILHTTVPTLALGLMGVATTGVSGSLVAGLGSLWAIGIALSMSLGAFAGAYYLSRGRGRVSLGSAEQKTVRASLTWLLVLLAVSTYAVLYVGVWYPQQFILACAVLLDGVVLFEAVRRYSQRRVRLYVPALIFTMSCYGLILYQAPYTQWYNAAAFGGIPWPLVGFPLLAVTVYYFTTRWREMRYFIPISVGVIALLIITVKVADVELVKGATIVALDPATKTVIQSWGFLNGYDVSGLYQEYPNPSDLELFVILLLAFALFLGVYSWITRIVVPKTIALAREPSAGGGRVP